MGLMFRELCRWEKLQKPQNSQFLIVKNKIFFVLLVHTTYSQDSIDAVGTPAQISFMTDCSLRGKLVTLQSQ
jgi:hypothetical protein